jgi:23S rRNA (uracil1939-C5)-methyltransferase
MSKTKKATLEITGIGAGGDGLAMFEGGQVYVPYTVSGDVVEVAINQKGARNWLGKTIKIASPSPHRIAPICKHFTTCGGCSLQHVAPQYYNDWIVARVETALSHQGITDANILPPMISPTNSRRRLALKAFHNGRSVILGFNKPKSHQIVNLETCPIAKPEMVSILPAVRELLLKLLTSRQGSEVEMLFLDGCLGMQISLPSDPDLAGREALASFANAHGLATLAISIDGFAELLAENSPFTYSFNAGVAVAVPISAFLQATDEGEAALQNTVMAAMENYSGEIENAVDLFSGLGTFSLPLAKKYKTHAVEGDLKLVNAQKSGAQQKAMTNLNVDHRDLFRRPLTVAELEGFDAVVFDPPRAGAEAQVLLLAQSQVPLIIGVSCNPNTFARDARVLLDGGYSLMSIQPVDQFLWSHHVELVGVFSRKL